MLFADPEAYFIWAAVKNLRRKCYLEGCDVINFDKRGGNEGYVIEGYSYTM
jgi:hemolysin-activating ACP:hemolysin acyltransferase